MVLHWKPLMAGLITLGCLGMLLLNAVAEQAPAPPPVVALMLAPRRAEPFTFGQVTEAVLTVKNLADRAIVVTGVTPLTNQGEDPVCLSSTVYGEIEQLEEEDAYRYYPMRQTQSTQTLHAGLLLPEQEVAVLCRYRPLAAQESFQVTFLTAAQGYDGTAHSLLPLKVYQPGSDPHGTDKLTFRPYSERAWRTVAAAEKQIAQPGPEAPQRAVLLIDAPPATTTTAQASCDFAMPGFFLDAAQATAAKIAGAPAETLKLAYCQTLGGYVVFEKDTAWLLKTPAQTVRETLLPLFPPTLCKDVDLLRQPPGPLKIRVGDKQEGQQTDGAPAGWKLWDTYPVWYGDGLSSRGEFVLLTPTQLAEFLTRVQENAGKLTVTPAAFRTRSYALMLPKP